MKQIDKEVKNEFHFQILAFTIHAKIEKAHKKQQI